MVCTKTIHKTNFETPKTYLLHDLKVNKVNTFFHTTF